VDEKQLRIKLSPHAFRRIPDTGKGPRKYIILTVAALLLSTGIQIWHFRYLADPVEKPMVCAHRGDNVHAPENTMPAFLAAAENGYGIELDVQLTADDEVVVFHDHDLKRACRRQKKICDLTYAELKEIPLFGSFERVPRFADVLAAVNGRVPLIVELKDGEKSDLLCMKTAALLDAYKGNYCVQSFDPRIVGWFRIHRPNVFRGQLITYREDYKNLSPMMTLLLACGMFNFMSRPHFIDHALAKKEKTVVLAEKLGALRCCWTAHTEGHEKDNDFVIFEDFRPECVFRDGSF
jgi:glycerophosphoryl diester phosphodiesterase